MNTGPASTGPDLTITDATVWSRGAWQAHRDVQINSGRVSGLVPAGSADTTTSALVVDGAGGHVIPGLVNTHTHLHQVLLRGVAEGEPLIRWLRYVAEGTVALTPEQAYLATAVAAVEALRSGTTALVEHMWPIPSTDVHEAIIRALNEAGIRAVLCRGVADRADPTRRWGFEPRLMQPLGETLQHIDHLVTATKGTPTTVGVAVPNPRSLTQDGMATVRAFAEERALPVSIHLLETMTDEQMTQEHAGVGAVAHLNDAGFLWDRLLAVHCVMLNDEGQRTLADHGVAISYNPISNMRLGSGVAPVPDMIEAGLRIGLGVDGAASNDRQDALEALRFGSYLQRAARQRSDLLGFAQMLQIATTGANAVLGLEDRPDGVVPGMQADLVLLRFDRDLACLPVLDPGASLLTTGSNRIVDTVLVDGRVILRDGHSAFLDERDLGARIQSVAPELADLLPAAG